MTGSHGGMQISKRQHSHIAALFCLIGILVIGDFDYLTGYKISLLVLYIVPVGFAAIFVGPAFGVFVAIISVAISIATDFWAGMPRAEITTMLWNAGIVLGVFLIVIGVLHLMNNLMLRLKASFEQRTQELFSEMEKRGRLEREIIDLSEKEQRRFGQELHDVVCQELAGVSIAAHMLARKLLATNGEEAKHAREIARMADQALETTRGIARGFFTAGFDCAGLAEALRETARHVESKNRISCVIHWQEDLAITHADTVIHLFRIAQEAVNNVVRHAGASHINVSLKTEDEIFQLTIEDDGKGIPPSTKAKRGLGMSIMAYRAGLIGGELKTETLAAGGTRVVCLVPAAKLNRQL